MARLREQDILSAALLQRFQLEGEVGDADGRHYGLILRDDGNLFCHHPGSPSPSPDQLMWAGDVLKKLNRELHHDGAWVVVFTHVLPVSIESVLHNATHADYGRYALIWLDQDGDAQFTVEWEAGITTDLVDFTAILLAGIHSTVQKCDAAWTTWDHHMRHVLKPKAGQTFKRAKGERAPSTVH